MRVFRFFSKGFTLVELLVVIAIIGILLAVILLSFLPAKNAAQDSLRRDTVRKLSDAVQVYALDHAGAYPSGGDAWIYTNFVGDGKFFTSLPDNVPYVGSVAACLPTKTCSYGTCGRQQGYCYATDAKSNNNDGTKAIIYTRLQSASCASAYFVWSSVDNKSGIVCSTQDPSLTSTFSFTYL